MQHFFAEKSRIHEGQQLITLGEKDLRHIRNVLRMRPGENLYVSDGEKKEYYCEIQSFEAEAVVLRILYVQEPNYELPGRICLFQGLPKSDKMELIIQKAVELGAHEVIPVAAGRSVTKLSGPREEKKVARWQQIAQSAAEQSRRMFVPKVQSVMSFREALDYAADLDVVLIPYELTQGVSRTKEVINQIQRGQSVGIFIGPEGGFEEAEVALAQERGAQPITLGHRILRTETAGLTALSILMFRLEGDE